jgi:hypothetical protein
VFVHHYLAMHDFWLLVWGLKSLQNFVKNFEKVLNGFEFKRFELKEFEKEKKRKDLTSLSARSGPPAHLLSSAAARVPSLLFFFLVSLTGRSHLSALLLPPAPFLSPVQPAPTGTPPSPSPPPLPPSIRGIQSRAVIPKTVSPPNPFCFPFPFLLFAVAPPTINGKCATPLPRFPFSPLFV